MITESLANDGYAIIEDFCVESELDALRSEMCTLHEESSDFIKKHSMTEGQSYLLNMVPIRVQKSTEGLSKTENIRSQFENKKIPHIAEQYLGQGWGVSNYIYHRACAEEHGTQELFPLHYDNFQNCRCLKGFLYIEDCAIPNGALRYIPKTHLLVRKVLSMKPHASLPDQENHLDAMLAVVEEIGLKCFTKEEQEIIKNLHKIVLDPKHSLKHAIERKAGTLILFDTVGIHGGVSVVRGERWIARFHLIDRRYRFLNHPEQEGFVLGIISRLYSRMKRWAN